MASKPLHGLSNSCFELYTHACAYVCLPDLCHGRISAPHPTSHWPINRTCKLARTVSE